MNAVSDCIRVFLEPKTKFSGENIQFQFHAMCFDYAMPSYNQLYGMPVAEISNILAVDNASDGQRLDNFLFRYFRHQPRSLIYKLVRSGQVRINSSRCKPSTRLATDDKVRVPPGFVRNEPHTPRLSDEKKETLLSHIFYRDETLIAYDKPSGQAVHAGTGHNFGLIESLRASLPDVEMLELVHRIDRLTSGCVLVATQANMRRTLHKSWRERKVEKTYVALVHGKWPMNKTYVDLPLEPESTPGLTRVLVNHEGKSATTKVKVLGYSTISGYPVTLLRLHPETGRMHQLRVHCQSLGHPVFGDPLYQNKQQEASAKKYSESRRMYLHAHCLRLPAGYNHRNFVAPGTQWRIDVETLLGDAVDLLPEGMVTDV